MSNRINAIKPRKWSKAGRDFLDKIGCAGLAGYVGVSRQLPSRWSLGHATTPEARVNLIIGIALGWSVCLTPSDLGRPDLMKKRGELLPSEGGEA